MRRQASKAGLDVLAFLPRTLFAMEARLQRVLNLTCPGVVAAYGLTDALLAADDWRACQDAARRAREEGYEAVRFPSATGSGENLAVFLDRLLNGSFIRILREQELQP
ncbi:MAG TPA: RES domain-containing protein [Longimicrobium sp.]|nr:RES domain-containing protein [Longimicrobium sp.]